MFELTTLGTWTKHYINKRLSTQIMWFLYCVFMFVEIVQLWVKHFFFFLNFGHINCLSLSVTLVGYLFPSPLTLLIFSSYFTSICKSTFRFPCTDFTSFCPSINTLNAPTAFSTQHSHSLTLCPLQVESGGAQPTVPPRRAGVAPAEFVGAGLPRSSLPQRPALQKHNLQPGGRWVLTTQV